MSKWKIFMMCLMVLALLAMPLLACGGDGGTEYDLTISVDPEGGGTTDPEAGTINYDEDEVVTITATAAEGYEFDSWSGDVADANSASTTVTMNADKTVTANFTEIVATYTLTYTAGSNGTLTGDTAQTVNEGEDGTAVTANAATGYHFVNWSDSSTDNPRTDTGVTADIDVTANFAINTYTLTYTAGSNGSITGDSPQTVNYGADGTAVTANADTGYHFVNWSDGSTDNPRTDTGVTADIDVTANFAIDSITYTLTYTAGSNGALTGDTAQTVNEGADGTAVTANADAGYHFVDWSDGSTDNPRTDTGVTADIDVTANFAIDAITYNLTYTAGPNGTLTGDTAQTVNEGEDGTPVTAVPDTGYDFVDWSDGSTDNPRTDTGVTADIDVTANFAAGAAPIHWEYEVVYTDPNATDPIGGNTSTWLVDLAGVGPYSTPFYNGVAVQMDIDYGTPNPERLKLGLHCYLQSGSVWIDTASNRMVRQGATVTLAGADVTVDVTNEWLDDVGMPERFIAHTTLIGGGPSNVADEYHETVVPGGPAPVVVPAGTFMCIAVEDYMIGEDRGIKAQSLGTGDGSTTAFTSLFTINPGEEVIYVDGVRQYRGTDYTADYGTGTFTFTTAPAAGAAITHDLNFILYTTGGDPTTGRLWRIDYADTDSPGVGLVAAEDHMYGYPDGLAIQELTSVTYP